MTAKVNGQQIRVLVTGATGFLGRNVLAALTNRSDVTPIAACRTPARLPDGFTGEVRAGDLTDPRYRRDAVDGIDVICHAGTWSSFWGHAKAERVKFLEPAVDLIDQAISARVRRFVLASTVVIAGASGAGRPVDDLAVGAYTGFWPHLDRLIDLERYMRDNRRRGTQMVSMRLGHFVGAGNRLGLAPVLASRLPTHLVPWLAGGTARLPLVADTDLGEAFALAATADGLGEYESFNICGPDFPTAREVIEFIAAHTGAPRPHYSVPYPVGHAFGWLMEMLHPLLPGSGPFLARSIVHVARDWWCTTDHATHTLAYQPRKPWRVALRQALDELAADNDRWPSLAQEV
jgi:nucleoside-diphosphate-sugar epimerase